MKGKRIRQFKMPVIQAQKCYCLQYNQMNQRVLRRTDLT